MLIPFGKTAAFEALPQQRRVIIDDLLHQNAPLEDADAAANVAINGGFSPADLQRATTESLRDEEPTAAGQSSRVCTCQYQLLWLQTPWANICIGWMS